MLYRNIGAVDRQEDLGSSAALQLNMSGSSISENYQDGNPIPVTEQPIQNNQVATPEPLPTVDNTAAVTSHTSNTPLLLGVLGIGAALLLSKNKSRSVSGNKGGLKQKDIILFGGLGVLAFLAYKSFSSSPATTSTLQTLPDGTTVTVNPVTGAPEVVSVPRDAVPGLPDPRASGGNRPTTVPGTATTPAGSTLYQQGRALNT